jgi:nuclear pore complex protein Nup133
MFSPDAANHTHSLRSKRTRQAAGNDDSIKLPQAKRKRSALRRDTFVEPLTEASLDEIASRETAQLKRENHGSDSQAAADAATTTTTSTNPSNIHQNLSIRGGRKTDKRTERGVGTLTLASNDFYTVSQLPALPDPIRNRPSVPYTCLISPEHGYALALTHTDGIIWPYNSSATSPSSKDVISFKLPLPPAAASDPLPLATFTARSASGEPGVLVVSPKWGKVVYWETITSASTRLPGQNAAGVHGNIPGMYSGETVQALTNAEPSGFVLTFNYGRVAHLTVRDSVGRPAIGVQFLRKSNAAPRGGIFGSIRNVFGGSGRKGTPMVRPARAAKGQRDVVIVTDDADFELWRTQTGAEHALLLSTNFKDSLLQSLSPHVSGSPGQSLQFKILDFELGRPGREVASKEQSTLTPLVVLLALDTLDKALYFLVEMSVDGSESDIKAIHPVKCYHEQPTSEGQWRPKLIVAASQPLVFIVFETAVVLFSLARIIESPSSQLLMEKQSLPDPFQDCISFQDDTIYRVLGSVSEDVDDQAACLIAVQGFGLVRFTSLNRNNNEIDVDDYQEQITAKSKIEQAVFFGTIKQNPFNLSSGSNAQFSVDEITDAAMEISSEILSSTSKFLPRGGPSIDANLKLRAKTHDDLVDHLLRQYSPLVTRNLRYMLLWNGEMLAAAQAVWKVQEDIQRRYPLKDREGSYLEFCLFALGENRHKKYPDAKKGETDLVRHWLLNNVEKVEFLLDELADDFAELDPMDVRSPQVVGEYFIEALDLTIAAFTAAFKFREDRAASYGLDDDIFEDGVLVAGYPPTAGVPWTSKPESIRRAAQLLDHVCNYLTEWWDYSPADAKSKKKKMPVDENGRPYIGPSKQVLDDIASRLPREVGIFNSINNEEIVNAIRHQEVIQQTSQLRVQVRNAIDAERRPRMIHAIQNIAPFNYIGAIELAEKLQDPGLLVNLTTQYVVMLGAEAEAFPDLRVKNNRKIREMQDRTEGYYDRFGNGWAYANFSRKIQNGELGTLLVEGQQNGGKKQPLLTWFLKKGMKRGQEVGKLSWINDVVGEDNYSRAEATLVDVAEKQESDLSNKMTELSLAKLASFAAIEAQYEGQANTLAGRQARKQQCRLKELEFGNRLAIIEIQTRLSNHINAAVGATIDAKAGEDVAIQIFAKKTTDKAPALRRLLIAGLKGIMNEHPLSAEKLIDVLTLMDIISIDVNPDEETDPSILGSEFFLALQVVEYADDKVLPLQLKKELRKMIWRRAMVRDDWNNLNATAGKNDQQVEEMWHKSLAFRTLDLLFQDYKERTRIGDEVDVEAQIFTPEQILGENAADSENGAEAAQNDATLPMEEVKESKESAASGKATKKPPAFVLPLALARRFSGNNTELEGVTRDMAKEQQRLRDFVNKAQLGIHFEGLVRSARDLVMG